MDEYEQTVLDEFLDVRADTWREIVDTHRRLADAGDLEAAEGFAALLDRMAAKLRAFAAQADPFCRGLLLIDADRYESTALDLRYGASGP